MSHPHLAKSDIPADPTATASYTVVLPRGVNEYPSAANWAGPYEELLAASDFPLALRDTLRRRVETEEAVDEEDFFTALRRTARADRPG